MSVVKNEMRFKFVNDVGMTISVCIKKNERAIAENGLIKESIVKQASSGASFTQLIIPESYVHMGELVCM
jgi:hypothetical protein